LGLLRQRPNEEALALVRPSRIEKSGELGYNKAEDNNSRMRVNRFDFLELGEEEAPLGTAEQQTSSEMPPQREIHAEILSDGTALAQVRISDPHGRFSEELDEEKPANRSVYHTELRVVEVFGERGDRAGEFNFPTGLAVDAQGILFVADSYNHRVQRITPDGGVAVIGSRGQNRGQFLSPQGIAVDLEQSFYIVEQGNHRVQKYSQDGVLLLTFGRPGRDMGELHGPTGIAVAPGSRDIFIADTGNSRIQRFRSDGRFLGTLGAGQHSVVNGPQALTVDASDNLYVADTFSQRILRFDPVGRIDTQWGGARTGLTFAQPRGLALDRTGLLYVADGAETDILSSDPKGRVQCIGLRDNAPLASLTTLGRGLGALVRPGGLAISPIPPTEDHMVRGDLYVADTMNHRILRFSWN